MDQDSCQVFTPSFVRVSSGSSSEDSHPHTQTTLAGESHRKHCLAGTSENNGILKTGLERNHQITTGHLPQLLEQLCLNTWFVSSFFRVFSQLQVRFSFLILPGTVGYPIVACHNQDSIT